MADPLIPTSPLHSHTAKFAAQPDSVTIAEEPFFTMADLWVDPLGPAADVVSDVVGARLPTSVGMSARCADSTVLCLGPEQWLIISRSRTGGELEAALQSAVRPFGGAATDVSAQRTSMRVSGEHVRRVLSKGCSLDLHPSVYREGTASQTMLGQAAVIIIALDSTGFDYRVLVRASFARYTAEWLIDASAEFREGVSP